MDKGYYGIFNDKIYEITDVRDSLVVASKKPYATTVKHYENRSTDISINLTNLTDNSMSNKEMYEKAVEKIHAEKITEIEKLTNRSKMLVYYKLISGTPDVPIIPDGKISPVADEGCIVTDFNMYPAIFPLGLTEDNEYLARWISTSGSVKIVRNYVQSLPIGISRHRESNYTLIVDRICVISEKTAKDVPHPSIAKFNDIYPNSPNSVTIYDTLAEGIEINPIFLSTPPSQISLHIEIMLNNYFRTVDRDDINQYLKANLEEGKEDPIPPIEDVGNDKSDKSDIGSDTNPKGDDSSKNDVKDPTDSSSDGGQSTDPTPENPDGNSESKDSESENPGTTETPSSGEDQNTSETNPDTETTTDEKNQSTEDQDTTGE